MSISVLTYAKIYPQRTCSKTGSIVVIETTIDGVNYKLRTKLWYEQILKISPLYYYYYYHNYYYYLYYITVKIVANIVNYCTCHFQKLEMLCCV